jgi:hypothetical protein
MPLARTKLSYLSFCSASQVVLASFPSLIFTPLALELLDTSHNPMQASERKHEYLQGMRSTSQRIYS